MTNEELKNMLFIIDTLLDDAITDSTRQKVKDSLTEVCQLAMKALEQRWIPVSERLPEDFEDVLVWYEYFRYGDYNRMFQTYGIGCYLSNMGAWSGDPGTGTKVKVFAWMPLPEPYKEGEADEQKIEYVK